MSEPEKETVKTSLRADIVAVWGEKTEKMLGACQSHMLEAVSTQLVLHQRYQCLGCLHRNLIEDFFVWLNEEGYVYIVDDFDLSEFMSHVIRWTIGWTDERLLSPCTDGMASSEIH